MVRREPRALTFRNVGETCLQNRFAGNANIGRKIFRRVCPKIHQTFAAARAGDCGIRRIGLGWQSEIFLDLAHALALQFKGRVTLVADVVETALGLAGIDHVGRAALRAGD